MTRVPAGRRGGRKLALEALYEHDVAERPVDEILARQAPGPARSYAERLVGGVREHGTAIDALIGAVAEDWTLDRMPPIDRNALRIGALELIYLGVPAGIAINEAVELAKQYSTADSGRFVNGILSRIDRDRAGV
ncbi:MAG TPA: transcription antitermination factor NusB [Acidimicrobiia bacterium]|nr:transcription antitermination factor NusB [Acidimicrobiia bacterium]